MAYNRKKADYLNGSLYYFNYGSINLYEVNKTKKSATAVILECARNKTGYDDFLTDAFKL